MKQPVLNAYEIRNADYAVVHSESEVDFNEFIEALAIKNGETVVDVGGGYGSIFIRLMQRHPEINFAYDLLDGGMFQLKKGEVKIKALQELYNNQSQVRYLHQDALQLDLPANHYDLVICKMFLHEIPEICKKDLIQSLFAIVKPGGRVVVWNPDLEENDYTFYTSVIRKKDELAGYESLVQNRHFLLNREFYVLMRDAGFTAVRKLLTFDYHLHTVNRLNEEFSGDELKLQEWNDYIMTIAEELDTPTRELLKIKSLDNDIYINFKRSVFSVEKPQV